MEVIPPSKSVAEQVVGVGHGMACIFEQREEHSPQIFGRLYLVASGQVQYNLLVCREQCTHDVVCEVGLNQGFDVTKVVFITGLKVGHNCRAEVDWQYCENPAGVWVVWVTVEHKRIDEAKGRLLRLGGIGGVVQVQTGMG